MNDPSLSAPSYSRGHVDHCAFDHWYPKLKHVAIKGCIISLPPPFVQYLLEDGIHLPTDCIASLPQSEDSNARIRAIQQVQVQVEKQFKELKGKSFIKLNWSSPRDAKWILSTLQCHTFDDIVLLLKSSDFITHDLLYPYRFCKDATSSETRGIANTSPCLVMKKWCNLHDSMLFRGFVRHHALIAMSQRHCEACYPFLSLRKRSLRSLIEIFFRKHLEPLTLEPAHLDSDFSFDVYIDKNDRVYLVDINVYGEITNPLLFSYKELQSLQETTSSIAFRIVETKRSIQPNSLAKYRVPIDFMQHLSTDNAMEAFYQQVKRDNASDEGSDDAPEEGSDDVSEEEAMLKEAESS
uniref:Cell division cycle protein 123 putative n=1 Tax=Albugo laibachii Nc14 TaxID=890382 RepID=F0VZS9_9STRA|nr:cell division cycle protein 123 putative [Albugo laibachii Nc14]|eukprot:CCA14300.1 cell division cycle protein 123 putative [Albugo laibachii Nc14]